MLFNKISALLSVFLFLGLSWGFAQQPSGQASMQVAHTKSDSVIRCGTMKVFERQMQNDPNFQERRQRIEEHVQEYISSHPEAGAGRSVVTIPVVFHVVYNNSSENLAEAQIMSQLEVLNEDFRRMNSDTTNTRSQFDSVAADTEVEFCIAQRDPNGNATNGITRTSTSHGPFSTNDDVKYDSQGGKDAWPASDYLNFWICNLDGGLLGYAQFPGGNPATDGVVVNYENVGDTLNVSAPYDLGRTGTHEVGHWLDLFHTFQNGCSGTTPSTCDTDGDRCCDTPPIQTSSSGCPSNTQNTCSETPERVDQWENYMDYTEDACMNMFSEDQKARMQALFAPGGARESLLNSQGCVPPASWDVAISDILLPSGGICQSSFDPEIVLTNNGSNQLDSVDIEYDIDGSGTQSYSWSGMLNSTESDTITLPTMSASSGSHTFNAYTLPNTLNGSNTDQFQANDTASSAFNIVSNGTNVTVTIETDCYGSEVTWEVLDSTGSVIGSGGPWSDQSGGDVHSTTLNCLATGCYDFKIYDDYGDGMYGSQWGGCSVNGDFYLVTDNGDTLTQMTTPNAAYGDSSVKSFCIQGPATIDSVDVTDVSCNGASDGSITIYPSGSDLEYSIDNGASYQFSNSFSGLGAGTYDVILQDTATGASDTTQVTISQPPALVLDSVVTTDPACGDSDGSIVIYASGGTTPYMYSIDNGSNFQGSNSFNGLPPATYDVVVEDSNGCTVSSTVTLNAQPGPSDFSVNVTDADCGSSNGSIDVTSVTGGSSPYEYQLDGGGYSSNSSFTGLSAGIYTVAVRDSNGCTYSDTVNVLTPNGPSDMSFDISPETCGDSNGSIEVTGVTGGTSPYLYELDGSGFTSTSTYSGLSGGTYTVSVQDDSGCTYSENVTVTGRSGPSDIQVNVTDASCGSADGELTVIGVTGGVAPYEFDFDGNGWTSDTSFTGLNAGSYSLVVRDSNGCKDSAQVNVQNPNAPTISLNSISHVSCNGGSDGSIEVTASGGNTPYSYQWDDPQGQTGSQATGLSAGIYTVTLTDDSGCTAVYTDTITEPAAFSLTSNVNDATCSGVSDGSISMSVSGGSSPYTYAWSNGGSGSSINGVGPGYYSVTVTDQNGCEDSLVDILVDVNSSMDLSFSTRSDECGQGKGSAEVSVQGGNPPYSYSWDNGMSGSSIDGLKEGGYSVEVTDSLGCKEDGSVKVSDKVTEGCLDIPSVITPNGDGINDKWDIQGLESFQNVDIKVFNRWGSLVFHTSDPNEKWDGTREGKALPEAAYHYIIVVNDGDKEFNGPVSIVR
ncbi:MAG: gliding motility-associated C-terminal domain-containing protein [Flavobacteriales bacterium]